MKQSQRLGMDMQQWHASGSDPIYAVGSCLFAGHPENITESLVLDAIHNLKQNQDKDADKVARRLESWWHKEQSKRSKVIVVFRMFQDEVVALFPAEAADNSGHCTCYAHIGQHGAADYNYVISSSRPATEDEYKALADELRMIGYTLEIKTRYYRK